MQVPRTHEEFTSCQKDNDLDSVSKAAAPATWATQSPHISAEPRPINFRSDAHDSNITRTNDASSVQSRASFVTDAGIRMLFSESLTANTCSSIRFSFAEDSQVTNKSLDQSVKHSLPRNSTAAGIEIDFNIQHRPNVCGWVSTEIQKSQTKETHTNRNSSHRSSRRKQECRLILCPGTRKTTLLQFVSALEN
jgi:hypothetical protein